jgi:hypothetical protein
MPSGYRPLTLNTKKKESHENKINPIQTKTHNPHPPHRHRAQPPHPRTAGPPLYVDGTAHPAESGTTYEATSGNAALTVQYDGGIYTGTNITLINNNSSGNITPSPTSAMTTAPRYMVKSSPPPAWARA